jgi:hypothetical protein
MKEIVGRAQKVCIGSSESAHRRRYGPELEELWPLLNCASVLIVCSVWYNDLTLALYFKAFLPALAGEGQSLAR